MGFIILKIENCIFINKESNIILYIYIDDLAVIGPNENIINTFINNIKKHFKVKNLGLIKDYLGIDIKYQPKQNYMKLLQKRYINKLLIKYNIEDYNPAYTPIDPKIKLEPNKELATKEQIKWF